MPIRPPSDGSPARTLPFFVFTLGSTWALQLPALLAQRGLVRGGVDPFLVPATLGAFAPLLTALTLSFRGGGAAGVRRLFGRSPTPVVSARWYVVALGAFPILAVVGASAYRVVGGMHAGDWFSPPESIGQTATMIAIPFAEEPGWRGFALPRLQTRYGPIQASVIVGIAWGLWHTVMWLLAGLSPLAFALGLANIVCASVVFTWLYNRTGGSLLGAMLAHCGIHLNNPFHALPGSLAPLATFTAATGIAAVSLIVFDRDRWRHAAS